MNHDIPTTHHAIKKRRKKPEETEIGLHGISVAQGVDIDTATEPRDTRRTTAIW